MLNTVHLMGRLTRDPELRYTQQGTQVTTFTLAVDRDYGKGEEKQTDFIDCVAWRSTAEFVSRYFSKGRMAVIKGQLQIRTWEDKNGFKRRTAEVVAENVYFGDSKRDDSAAGAQPTYGTAYGAANSQPAPRQSAMDLDSLPTDPDDNDLPF